MTTSEKILREIRKPIKLQSAKKRNSNLEMFCGDFAEAYEVGVEEAQRDILDRVRSLIEKEPA